jgi:hypothetical protein
MQRSRVDRAQQPDDGVGFAEIVVTARAPPSETDILQNFVSRFA